MPDYINNPYFAPRSRVSQNFTPLENAIDPVDGSDILFWNRARFNVAAVSRTGFTDLEDSDIVINSRCPEGGLRIMIFAINI